MPRPAAVVGLALLALAQVASGKLYSLDPTKKKDQRTIIKELTACAFDVIIDVRHHYYYHNWRVKGASHYPWNGFNLLTKQNEGKVRKGCTDGKKTGLYDSRTRKPLSCPQLAPHCQHRKFGAHIRKTCCHTCETHKEWDLDYIKKNNITRVGVYCWVKPWQSDPASRYLEKKFGKHLEIYDMKGLAYLDDIPSFCKFIDGNKNALKKFAPHCAKSKFGSHKCPQALQTLAQRAAEAKNKAMKKGISCQAADVTGDGKVSVADVLKALEHYGWDGTKKVEKDIVSGAKHEMPDINEDLLVNVEDLLLVLGHYGAKCYDSHGR